MHARSLFRHRSIGGLFLTPSSHERVWSNIADRFQSFQTVVSSGGDAVCGQVSFSNSLAAQIVYALQLGDRSRASSLFSQFSTGTHVLRTKDLHYILGYCARKPDPLFVIETWNVLDERNVLSDKCYLHIIRALCNGGYFEEAFSLVKFIGENQRMDFILSLYNSFLLQCIRIQDVKHAHQCLDLMDSQMVGKNEGTYFALLELAVWKKNLSAVHGIWKEYVHYYSMDIKSMGKFIWSFASLNDLESAYRTLAHLVELASKPEVLKGMFFFPGLDVPIPSQSGAALDTNDHPTPISMYDEEVSSKRTDAELRMTEADGSKSVTVGTSMSESKFIRKVLRSAFNNVIHACAKSQNAKLAEHLILQMQNLGLKPTSHAYNCLLRAHISERGCGESMEALKLMLERNVKLYDSTLADLSVACSKELNLDRAELLLNQISHPSNVYPFNAFLAACDSMDQPDRAIGMLAKMETMKVKPDINTYELLFSLFVNVNAPYEEGNMLSQGAAAGRAKAIEMHMRYNGIQHSARSLKHLLRAFGTEGMVREMMQYLQPVEYQLVIQNSPLATDIYNIVLQSFLPVRQSYMAIEMFKNMKMYGISPNAATYTIMIDCCSNIRCFKSASVVLSMMIRDGFWPLSVVTYTALMKILLDAADFDGALSLLRQALTDGSQPDVLFFNTFLNQAQKQGRIDIIEFIVEHMHRSRVPPDPSTCQYVFSAYAEGEFHSTALEALEVLSLRMISEDETVLQKIRANLEESFILAEDSAAEMRIMQLLWGSDEENVCFALLNLRWCAVLGCTLSWDPNESPWARRLSTTYDR